MRKNGWRLDCGGKTSNVGGQCGGDHQLVGKISTITKGAIPLDVREGDFVTTDKTKKSSNNNHWKLCSRLIKRICSH
jgi:hypothetical protein